MMIAITKQIALFFCHSYQAGCIRQLRVGQVKPPLRRPIASVGVTENQQVGWRQDCSCLGNSLLVESNWLLENLGWIVAERALYCLTKIGRASHGCVLDCCLAAAGSSDRCGLVLAAQRRRADLSEPPDHADPRLCRRRQCRRDRAHRSVGICRNGSASPSSSNRGPARAATLPPIVWRNPRRTDTRC